MRKYVALIAVGSLLAVAGLFGFNGRAAAASSGCDDYAIMRCGASGPANFIEKARADAPGDLKDIYADYGLVPAEYGKFVSSAKHGTIYNDGRIMVDGVNVGRSNLNVGRVHDSNFDQPVHINGKTYWGGPFGSTYHANTADVMVMFNDKGVMQFAVISSCGNPQRITPNAPDYSCKNLRKTAVAGRDNTYTFTTAATASRGAEVVKVEYDFGDGTSRTVQDLSQPVQHTFTKSSKVRATVYVRVPGGSLVTTTSSDCTAEVTVKETPPQPNPEAMCKQLTAVLLDQSKRNYKFTATAVTKNGAVLTAGKFNFGDGQIIAGVRPNGNNVVINHSYAQAGTYTVTAVLTFKNPNGGSTQSGCQTSVMPTTQYCKPNIPVGSPECSEQTETCVPEGKDDSCTLTNTGPGAVIAAVGCGATAVGTLGHYLWRRRSLGY